MAGPELLSRVDHLVYSCAELERGIGEIEQVLGVRARLGCHHPMWGTHNALVALGVRSYLEIIAPDADHAPTSGLRPFGLDAVSRSHLVAWAASGREPQTWRNEAAQGRDESERCARCGQPGQTIPTVISPKNKCC